MIAVLQQLQEMMTTNSGIFLSDGIEIFRYAVIIVTVLMGIKFQHTGDLLSVLLTIIRVGFCATMLWFYILPIPGYGHSFLYLVTAPGQHYASVLANGSADDLMSLLDTVGSHLEAPAVSIWIDVRHILAYVMSALSIYAFQVVVLLVIGIGYFAVALYGIMGPIMIVGFVIPGMEWTFWGWLRAILIASFYQVFAYGFLNVYSRLIINFLTNHPPPYDAATMVASFGGFVILLLTGVGTALAIPMLVVSMFLGGGGGSSWMGKFWGR